MTREELYAHAESTKVDITAMELLGEGFEIFKKNIGGFIGILFLTLLGSMIISFIPFLGGIVSTILGILISAGQLIVIRKIRQGEATQFNDFFAAFNSAGPPIVLSLVQGLLLGATLIPLVIVIIVFFFAQIANGDFFSNPTLIMSIFPIVLLCLLPVIFLGICYTFSLHILLFINQDFWTAMEASRRYVMKNFWSIFGFLFVIGFISTIIIVVTCGLGYFVMAPTASAAIYLAFEKIFKPSANTLESKIDTFGLEQKDINTEADERNN